LLLRRHVAISSVYAYFPPPLRHDVTLILLLLHAASAMLMPLAVYYAMPICATPARHCH